MDWCHIKDSLAFISFVFIGVRSNRLCCNLNVLVYFSVVWLPRQLAAPLTRRSRKLLWCRWQFEVSNEEEDIVLIRVGLLWIIDPPRVCAWSAPYVDFWFSPSKVIWLLACSDIQAGCVWICKVYIILSSVYTMGIRSLHMPVEHSFCCKNGDLNNNFLKSPTYLVL